MLLLTLLIFINILFLSYEFIIFNEEFFIAFVFFSFFFAASSVISGLLISSYNEDKIKVFQFVSDDIFVNYSFLNSYVSYLTVYEYNKEFLYQYMNFLIDGLFLRFINFYNEMLLNKSLNLTDRIPEVFFNFSDKLLSFVTARLQNKFLEYFNTKWDNLILAEILNNLDELESNSISSVNEEKGWTYGLSF